ncbi:MAG: universal stress protein [Sphingomonadales bacterium]|nr:universal stress protein [Sphingomonadales bacterium]
MGKQTYLVAVDGSEWSARAADQAVKLAKQTGASVHFISVISTSEYQSMLKVDQSPSEELKEANRAEVLSPIEAKYADSGVEIECQVLWGHPVENIHELAKTTNATMIFVGRRGRSRVADIVLGSVANGLAHKAGVPIVLVP